MKIILALFIFFFLPLSAKSQDNIDCDFDSYVTEIARYKDGGEVGLQKFIASHIVYPDSAFYYKVEGRVNLAFVVDSLGGILDIRTLGTENGYGLEEEAIRVLLMTSGNWIPSMGNDKPVCQRFRMPIKFELDADSKPNIARDTVYEVFDVTLAATFTGGFDSLDKKIDQNLEWPESMATTCGDFMLSMEFVVNEDGTVSDIEVVNSQQFEELVVAAKKALQATDGGWSPAYKDSKRVKMRFRYPI